VIDLLPTYILAAGISLLTLWGIAFSWSRTTARLHSECGLHILCSRFIACVLVAGLLAYVAVYESEIQYRWIYATTAILLGIAAFGMTTTDFREHGLLICGVFLPWSWIRRIGWRQRQHSSVMRVRTDWGLRFSVPISRKNVQAVDRLVRSAARYEPVPLGLWLSTWLIQFVLAIGIGVAVLAALIFTGVL